MHRPSLLSWPVPRLRRAGAVAAALALPLAVAAAVAGPAVAAARYTVTATIPVGSYPLGVAANPHTGTVYVANVGSDTVSVISGPTDTVTATIPVGGGPRGVASTRSPAPSTSPTPSAPCR